jgi:hypothetical protein
MNGPRASNPSAAAAAPSKAAAGAGKAAASGAASPSSTYAERNRQEDPVPTDADKPKVAVVLSACQFLSKPPKLAIEKEFEVSCKATWRGDQAPESLRVAFKIAMKWTEDGKPKEEEALEELEAHLDAAKPEQAVTAKGTLPRPPSFPADGTKVAYRLVASHPSAAATSESEPVELTLLEIVHHAEVRDVHFAHGGHFPCLDEHGWLLDALAKSIGWAKESGEQLVVFGHTDTSGGPRSNFEVSERRAKASLALLSRDASVWDELAKNNRQTDEMQACLKGLSLAHGWDCDPGKVDGEDGPKTKAAVKAFQKRCNALYQLGIRVDAVVDPATWKAMHRVICGLLAAKLGVPDPAEPTYPLWDAPSLGFPEGQGAYPCGESFPIEAANFDGLYSQMNRRVDFLFGSGWNDLHAPPSRDKSLTKEQCWPFDPEKTRWEPIGGASPSPSGGETEPPVGPAILELAWEKTVVLAWDASDQPEMETKTKVKTQGIESCDDAVLEIFQYSADGNHCLVKKFEGLKLEADVLHGSDGSELEVKIDWHDTIYGYGKSQYFCKLSAQGQEKTSAQERAGLLQLKHHDGLIANPSGDLPGAGVEGVWVDDYLGKLGLWLEATNDEIIADGHRVKKFGAIDNAGMKILLERNKFLHHQSSHGTAYCLCDGNKNYVDDSGIAGADGANDWLCPVCGTCDKAVGVIMNKDFDNLFFREEVGRLAHAPKVLVLANCCLTTITPDYPKAWLSKGTRWYIGWAIPVDDDPAVNFAKAFYRRWFGAYRMDPDKVKKAFNDVKAPYVKFRPRIFGR